MALDPKLNYKHHPRSVSWQVASVLNPSLQNSLPASQQSKHTRDKREKSEPATGGAQNCCSSMNKPGWQEEESLPLPPQYVSPRALCKAMPKYMRVKAHPSLHGVTTAATNSCSSPAHHNAHHTLPFSPHYDFAIGSPRSDHSSNKLTPRSVLESPKQGVVAASDVAAAPPGAMKVAAPGYASPASPARSPAHPNVAAMAATGRASISETATPLAVSAHAPQNTPQTLATSASRSSLPHSPSDSRRHSRAQSPRIRSAATSPMHPASGGMGGPHHHHHHHQQQAMDATSLQWKLSSTIAQHPELQQRVVPQMQSAAQGSPLSPANSSVETVRRDWNHNATNNANGSPPVALPPTPPQQKRKTTRMNNSARSAEPTLETYQKISPNTYATNTVWNDRRDQRSAAAAAADPTQPRRTILIKSN